MKARFVDKEFGEWWAKADRQVRRTQIRKGVEVSTVFLGHDHNFGDHGPPVLFETMIFGGSKDEEFQVRSCTWGEALAAHREAILVSCGAEGVPPSEVRDVPSPRRQAIEKAREGEPPAPTWHERLMKDDDD